MRALLILLVLLAVPARAETIVLGLSQNRVSITATFDGEEILIFGAVNRDAPAPVEEGELGVIITVEGPDLPVKVFRKARRLGIWVNVDEVEVDTAPSFYAVATSAPLRDVLRDTEDLRNSITLPRAIRSVDAQVADSDAFTEALIRIKQTQDLYQTRYGAIDLQEDTLFRVSFELPATLPEGDYTARIFLTRAGRTVDRASATIPVQKVGIEQWLYEMAQTQSVFYGLLSLALAIAAGWGASAGFAALRR